MRLSACCWRPAPTGGHHRRCVPLGSAKHEGAFEHCDERRGPESCTANLISSGGPDQGFATYLRHPGHEKPHRRWRGRTRAWAGFIDRTCAGARIRTCDLRVMSSRSSISFALVRDVSRVQRAFLTPPWSPWLPAVCTCLGRWMVDRLHLGRSMVGHLDAMGTRTEFESS